MSDFSFKRKERIRKRADFITTYKKGIKLETQHLKIALKSNNLEWSRLGLTVSKKIGNAVQRNHVKRRLREYFRLNKAKFAGNYELVITAKTGADELKYNEICAELNAVLNRTKLLLKDSSLKNTQKKCLIKLQSLL